MSSPDPSPTTTTTSPAVFHHSVTSTTTSSASKRKLDEFIDDAAAAASLINTNTTTRMRKDQSTLSLPFNPQLTSSSSPYPLTSVPTSSSASSSSAHPSSASSTGSTPRVKPRPLLQFFVRTISHKTLVFQADRNDTVKSVHERILAITNIPIIEQRLIYRGRQLQWEQTLAECDIQPDAGLQLVGRMRSTGHPQAWQLLDDMVGRIFHLYRGGRNAVTIYNTNNFVMETETNNSVIKSLLSKFLNMTRQHNDADQSVGHLQIFLASSAPAALVMLYMSLLNDNRKIADEAIRHFITSSRSNLSKATHTQCAPIVLEFCKLLSKTAGTDDALYIFCRNSLGSMVENVAFRTVIGGVGGSSGSSIVKGSIDIREIFQFVSELARKLSHDLALSMGSATFAGPSLGDVRDFTSFLSPVRNSIEAQLGVYGPITFPLQKGIDIGCYNVQCHGEEIEFLHGIYFDLMGKMDMCLKKMEGILAIKEKGKLEQHILGWGQYLAILKELNGIAKLFEGAGEMFWGTLRERKVSLCYLICRFAKRIDDNKWILEHKEVTNFEARRHLVMMMLPDVKDEYEELHEMLIDRSQLLAESFEYIVRAEPESLRGGLFMEFKNEEATGPGVLREWFFLVFRAIFNPQNALFVACPKDHRRFFPNPASKVDPLHLEYFSFSGRVVALALMHKIQVGIVFDRVFFVQLAGETVSLEDIREADPILYNSCKKILEMDADLVDQDTLGLTFVREVEELGSRKDVDLCPDGSSISVTSKNRDQYVNLLIQHRFVTSIADQVAHFAHGFADVIGEAALQRSFFKAIDLEDFDWMLHGSEAAICVEDWKAHTDYNGYKETDPQIIWFWKIVGQMTAEQRRVLLFFWTSIKYLPAEGFGGLASRLFIYRTHESFDRLPSSHTCFYRLCFPPYPSKEIVQDRFQIITQEHVGCSFGNW